MGYFSNTGYGRILEEFLSFGTPTGITYRPNTDQFFIISTSGGLRIVDRHNNIEQDDIVIGSSDIPEPQSIVHLSGSRFAALQPDAPPVIQFFTILPNDRFVTEENILILDEIDITTNSSARGLAYDSANDDLYVLIDNLDEGDGGLWRIQNYTSTNPIIKKVWDNYEVFIESGEVDVDSNLSGVTFGSAVGTRTFFISTYGDTHRIFEVDVSGNVLSSFGHGILTVVEDLVFDPVYKDLFLVGNGSIFRYERLLGSVDVVPSDLGMINVNHSGADELNPIVEGLGFRLTLHKHDPAEQIRHCWITVGGTGGGAFVDLTSRIVSTESELYVDVVSGVDLKSGNPPRLNVIHFTTTEDTYRKAGIFVRDLPPNRIELDGYNADQFNRPLIIPLFVESG